MYRLVLADAMGAVGGLIFSGGIPPGVDVNNRVGGGEGEAGATGLEADQKDGEVAILEGVDAFLALPGFAGDYA